MKRVVVNLPGGGIRGVAQAVVLDELENRIGHPLALFADLVVGNSTGGILAGLLTITKDGKTPLYTANQAKEFYVREGPYIFARGWFDVSELLHVKYPAEPLEAALKRYMGDAMLSDALTNTMIAYADWRTKGLGLFKSHKAKVPGLASTYDVLVRDAAYATAAAPTYFPHHDGLIDGGMVATNPGMFALTEARKLWPDDEIHIITIGNGLHTKPFPVEGSKDWGGIKLVEHVVDLLLNGPSNEVGHMMRAWNTPERCYEIQAPITGNTPNAAMDAASPNNIQALIDFGKRMLEDNAVELDRIVKICKQ